MLFFQLYLVRGYPIGLSSLCMVRFYKKRINENTELIKNIEQIWTTTWSIYSNVALMINIFYTLLNARRCLNQSIWLCLFFTVSEISFVVFLFKSPLSSEYTYTVDPRLDDVLIFFTCNTSHCLSSTHNSSFLRTSRVFFVSAR